MRQRDRIVRRMSVCFALAVLCASCGDRQGTVHAIELESDDVLELTASCATVEVVVVEGDQTVELDVTFRDFIDGDCAGVATARLAAPLGDRKLEVNGNEWIPSPPGCPYDFVKSDDPCTEFTLPGIDE